MNKTFNINFDSVEDCKKLQNILKSRIGELQSQDTNFITKNKRSKIVFDSCLMIMETDISRVYNNLDFDLEKKYYVYAHCDPGWKIALKKEGKSTFAATLGMEHYPFYIGKGTGQRAFELNRNDSHRKYRQKIHKFGKEIEVKLIRTDLTELEALMLESKLIDIFGTLSTGGRLVNLDEGINNKERRNLYSEHLQNLSLVTKNSV